VTRLLLGAALATGAAISAPASALAQSADPTDRPIRFGIAGGVALPIGDFKDGVDVAAVKRDFKQGFAGQAFLDVRAPGTPLGFRAAVALNRFQAGDVQFTRTTPGGTQTATAPDGYSQILAGIANVTLQLPTGPIRPYVLAGLGAFNVKNAANVAIAPGGSLIESDAQTSTNFGINGGAGVLLRLGRIEGFVEARLTNVYTKEEKFANLKSVQFIPVTVGLTF
jgi:opacity protein-like surface antigen